MKRQDQPFHIAVRDDNPEDLKTISELTRQILQKETLSFALTCYKSGNQLMQALSDGLSFDLFLLDVIMPGQDGMELAAPLRKKQLDVPIIFISCSREMALNGYRVSAVRKFRFYYFSFSCFCHSWPPHTMKVFDFHSMDGHAATVRRDGCMMTVYFNKMMVLF